MKEFTVGIVIGVLIGFIVLVPFALNSGREQVASGVYACELKEDKYKTTDWECVKSEAR